VPIHTNVVLRQLLFGGALLALAASSTSVVLSGARLLAAGEVRQAAAAECAQAPRGTSAASAYRVGVLFVRTAVLRRHEVCSYELVTRELQPGLTRKEWATGNIPVQAFPTRDPRTLRIEYTPSSARAGERTSFVLLESADLGRAMFELVVVARGGRWLVGYWGPAPSAAAFGAPAMP
jgi:hypothetical protein